MIWHFKVQQFMNNYFSPKIRRLTQ